MKTFPQRVVIYPKDVMNITGRKERTAQKLLARIRKKLNKAPGSFVSVEEFCAFTGLSEEKIARFLQ